MSAMIYVYSNGYNCKELRFKPINSSEQLISDDESTGVDNLSNFTKFFKLVFIILLWLLFSSKKGDVKGVFNTLAGDDEHVANDASYWFELIKWFTCSTAPLNSLWANKKASHLIKPFVGARLDVLYPLWRRTCALSTLSILRDRHSLPRVSCLMAGGLMKATQTLIHEWKSPLVH